MKKSLFLLSLLVTAAFGFSQVVMESGSQLIVSSGSQVIAGNGVVNNGGSIDIANTGTIEIQGDLENNDAALTTTTTTGTLKFNGTSAQEITGNHDAEFYGTVEIDNSNGVSITNTVTGNNQTINGTLVFINGLLTLNDFNLTLSNDVTTPGMGKYIQTNSTGVLKRTVGATNTLFPIGNSSYNPITLNNTGTSDIYSAQVVDTEPSDASSDHFVDRSWRIDEGTPGGGDLTVTPQWNSGEELTDFDRTNSSVGLTTNNGTDYTWATLGGADGSDPYTREGASFTDIGTFAVADNWIVNNIIIQQIDLTTGWNIASFNVMPDHMQTDSIFKDMKESGVLVKAIDESGGFIQDIPGLGWLNTIGDMYNTEGYYVKVASDHQMTPRGSAPELPFDIPFISGWNIMGYPLHESQDAMNALQSIIDSNHLVKVIDEAGGFIQNIPGLGWLNTIVDLDPGEGYYIKVSAIDTITLDSQITKSTPDLFPNVKPELFELAWSNNGFNPMNIIVRDISLNGIEPEEGDEIAVYDGDLCVGSGVVVTYRDKLLAQLVASMDDPTTEKIEGYTPGNPIYFKYLRRDDGELIHLYHDYVWGVDYFESLETYVCNVTNSFANIQDNKYEDIFLKCYPNPTKRKLNLSYILPTEGEVNIELHDIYGNRIALIENGHTSTDPQLNSIDMSHLSRGMYLLKFTVKSENNVITVIEKVLKQ